MPLKLADIAAALGADCAGDGDQMIEGAAEPAASLPGQLAIAISPDYAAQLAQGQATAALLAPGMDWQSLGLTGAIFAPRGRLAMAHLSHLIKPDDGFAPGIDDTAKIDRSAQIGRDVAIGPFAVIGPDVQIGDGTRIGAHVTLGTKVQVGSECDLYNGVRICARVHIGDRVICQPGAVIGSDGFSFVTETPSNAERAKATGGAETLTPMGDHTWTKLESLGSVIISDDVEIGANSTVDAGTIRPTVIGRGTKIDNLVQIGHNVVIGEDCTLSSQAGVAGSSVLGNRVVLGGKTGVADHIKLGDDVVAGGGSVILSSQPAGRVVLGYPAQRMDRELSLYKTLRRLARGNRPGKK